MIPAAVSQTEIKIEMSWASLEHKLQTESPSQPSQPDAGASLQNIQILEYVWHCHQPEGSQEPQTDPGPVQVYGDKWGRNGEVVNEGVELQHEPELVRGGDELKYKQR